MGVSSQKMIDATPYREEQLMEHLRNKYIFRSDTQLLDKHTNSSCTLCKITGYTKQQCLAIKKTINSYLQSECSSIMHLREFGQIQKDSYCSTQQTYCLIFDGNMNNNLRTQYFRRRKHNRCFTPKQIISILSCILCGLRQYKCSLKRKDVDLQLSSVLFQQENSKLFLIDPWLPKNISSLEQITHSHINSLSSYPSPEKIRTSLSAFEDYDEDLSNLFSAGALGLVLSDIQTEKSSLYTSKYGINQSSINSKLQHITDFKLRNGLEMLLSDNPEYRENIYKQWEIECHRKYYLQQEYHLEVMKTVSVTPSYHSSHIHHQNKVYQPYIPAYTPNLNIKPNNAIHKSNISTQNFNISHSHQQKQVRNDNLAHLNNKTIKTSQVYLWNQGSNWKKSNDLANKVHFQFSNSTPMSSMPSMPSVAQNFHYNLGIKETESRIKPIQPYFSPNISSRRQSYSQKSNRSISPLRKDSPNIKQNRNPQMSTSLNLEPQSHEIIHLDIKNTDKFGIKLVETERTNITKQSDEDKKLNFMANTSYVPKPIPQSVSINTTPKQIQSPIISKQQFNQPLKSPSPQKIKQQIILNGSYSPQKRSQQILLNKQLEKRNPLKTPEMRNKLKHRYNSTIVQVNEETPSQRSLSSDTDLEYVNQEYDTGSRFQGHMKMGQKNGYGKFYFVDGGVYDGNWKGDQMHGWGKLYYQNGKLAYEGNWMNGEFHGYGKVFNDNPMKLKEGFDYTNFDMLGDFWREYQGMFSKDTKEGRGRIFITNGQIFEGDFHNDRIQGFGKFLRKDGLIIEGIWKQSRLIKILNN